MKQSLKKCGKVFKWITIILALLLLILLLVRQIGRTINNRTPDGGINETMYINVNGQEQWISFYGEDMDNPVMLYLHGGPGMSTSFGDWTILRKLAKDYTVVCWDQRNCGKTWLHDPQDTPITPEIMRSDLLVVTNYILDYMNQDDLTLLGNSWGTLYGCDFALAHPELVACIINTSQVVDEGESQQAQKAFFLEWSKNDPEYYALAQQFDPNFNMSDENNEIFYRLAEKYTKDGRIPADSYFDGDVNVISAVFFNPYYSLGDLLGTVRYFTAENGQDLYMDYIYHGGCYQSFSIMDRTEYEMPIYIFEGNMDYQAVHTVAEEYYQRITAPDKDFRYIDGGHVATMVQSEVLAEFVHEIAEKQKKARE